MPATKISLALVLTAVFSFAAGATRANEQVRIGVLKLSSAAPLFLAKDRGYFDSVYVRTPGGAMFEATVSKPTGFTIDEPIEELGQNFQVPPVFEDRREFLLSYLEPLQYS